MLGVDGRAAWRGASPLTLGTAAGAGLSRVSGTRGEAMVCFGLRPADLLPGVAAGGACPAGAACSAGGTADAAVASTNKDPATTQSVRTGEVIITKVSRGVPIAYRMPHHAPSTNSCEFSPPQLATPAVHPSPRGAEELCLWQLAAPLDCHERIIIYAVTAYITQQRCCPTRTLPGCGGTGADGVERMIRRG